MSYFGCKFVKFFVELPTFDCKICLFSLKISSFYNPKIKFKHTLKCSICDIYLKQYAIQKIMSSLDSLSFFS